jgi:hypothetical protein
MDTPIDPGDQIEFPDPALKLPHSQCGERGNASGRKHGEQRKPERGTDGLRWLLPLVGPRG